MNPDEIWKYITDDFSNLDNNAKKQKASEVRSICATFAAGLSIIPIPFADIFTITPVQYLMVRAIGNIYGYKLDENAAKEVVAVVGGAWLGQQTCLALFKIGLPGAGGAVGSAFVFGWTYGMGKAAELYFESGMTATKEEIKNARSSGEKEAKNTYENIKAQNENLKERIDVMRSMGSTKEQIIYALWGAKSGESEKYRQVEAEYKRLIGE